MAQKWHKPRLCLPTDAPLWRVRCQAVLHLRSVRWIVRPGSSPCPHWPRHPRTSEARMPTTAYSTDTAHTLEAAKHRVLARVGDTWATPGKRSSIRPVVALCEPLETTISARRRTERSLGLLLRANTSGHGSLDMHQRRILRRGSPKVICGPRPPVHREAPATRPAIRCR